ncbi:MAG: DVU0772 family protein [Desulfobacterales bacterium]
MMNLEELKQNREIVGKIDWEMTPEEAVRLYLEWGNNWAGGNYVIRSKEDVSYYFVVYAWDKPPVIYLIRRNSEEALELARIVLPGWLKDIFLAETSGNNGVYPIRGRVRQWLESELAAG